MGRTPRGETRERIFRFVRKHLLEGRPPTVRDVQRAFGFRAVQTAREHLEALVAEDPDPSGIADDLRRGERLTAPKVAPAAAKHQTTGTTLNIPTNNDNARGTSTFQPPTGEKADIRRPRTDRRNPSPVFSLVRLHQIFRDFSIGYRDGHRPFCLSLMQPTVAHLRHRSVLEPP